MYEVLGTQCEIRHSKMWSFIKSKQKQVKNGQVSGFHNWIMFYLEERKGDVDYRGYIKPRSRRSTAETNDDDHVLTLQFSWK